MDERYWFRLLPCWQKNKAELNSAQIKFAPQLAIIRDGGWKGLELRLMNRCSKTVWVEEARVLLADLDANMQAVVPTGQARHPILQNVEPNEGLGVNLARTIYEAAGRPQGTYSCIVIADVRFRVFNNWCNAWGRQRLRVRPEHGDILVGRN